MLGLSIHLGLVVTNKFFVKLVPISGILGLRWGIVSVFCHVALYKFDPDLFIVTNNLRAILLEGILYAVSASWDCAWLKKLTS